MSLVAVTSVKNTKRQMEKQRDDENFAYVAAVQGNQVMLFYKEALVFDNVKLVTRSYK
jgi:succinate dehydrogenase / fumarate reductase flavoprotein subunit